jgi:hypothetical protein
MALGQARVVSLTNTFTQKKRIEHSLLRERSTKPLFACLAVEG